MGKLLFKKAISVTLSAALLVTSLQTGGITAKADTTQTEGNGAVEQSMIQITDESQVQQYETWREDTRVSVHDPSVIQDPKTGRYYIFGSHCAWAWSDDLENWKSFTNNITEGDNGTAHTIFKDEIEWCKKANTNYTVTGNMWAPDVIWNETMQKWCMYMSINGPRWNSTISLLTADSLSGNWTYVGQVIQSGMSNGFGPTFDYKRVMGNTDVSRFTSSLSGGGNPTIEAHAIDPCVIYDDDGNLWLTYGSWSGGISMIALDKTTGLRDYNVTYQNTNNTVDANGLISDPYTGYKIAGGTAVSGEGSYIQKIGDYYFLFMSYGAYDPWGGYNMRVFRSADIKGPYTDVAGRDARRVVNTQAGNTTGATGMRLMSYYQWSFQDYGHTASGHNSAIVDKDTGKAFVVYHDKFNDGTAGHLVRTHQLFLNEDGWMIAAPFEYKGESISKTGYGTDTFTGNYQVILQKQNVNHATLECCTEESVKLEEGTEVKDDGGNVTGYTGAITGAYTGTWESKAGSPYITMKIGNVTYKGVLCEGTLEETNIPAMTFTAVGDNNVCIWGYKVTDPKAAIQLTLEKTIQIPKTIAKDIQLPTSGFNGAAITWKSNHIALSDNGEVLYLKEDSDVTLTATIRCDGFEYTKNYNVTVMGSESLSSDKEVLLESYCTEEPLNITGLVKGDAYVRNPFFNSSADLKGGAVISFDVNRTAASGYLSNILTFLGTSGRLYFTGGSYLGYNGPGGFFDANVNYWSEATNYLKTGSDVNIKIKLKNDGFEVYADEKLIYSKETLTAGTTKGNYAPGTDDKGVQLNLDTSLMNWLVNNASRIHFGYGSWWDGAFNGKISNLKFYYTQPAIDVTGSTGGSDLSGIYTQDYENITDVSGVWTSPNAQEALAIKNNEAHGNYVVFIHDNISGNKNTRGMYSEFGANVTWEDNYIFEFDLGFKSGNNQDSQFAVTNSNGAYTNKNVNDGIDSGYVLKLTAAANATKWYINGSTEDYVELPSADADAAGWVHVKITGTTSEGKATLEITDQANTSLYQGEIVMNNAANIKGFYVRAGRSSSIFKIDNISVKKVGVQAADFSAYKKALARAEKFVSVQSTSNAYTQVSMEALQNAIAIAKEKVTPDLEKSQQDIVDTQTAALIQAVDKLEYAVYKVSLGAYKGGTITGLNAEGNYQGGSSVSLTAVPNEGCTFIRWEDENGNTVSTLPEYTAMVTGNMTLVPVFKDPNQKEPVEPDAPEPKTIQYTPTLTLRDVALPNGWTWKNPATSLTSIGTASYPAIYTTTDPEMYKDATADIQVTVEKATPTYTAVSGLTGILGEKLSTVVLPTDTNGTWQWLTPDTVMTTSTNIFDAVFTPKDSEHYAAVNCKIEVTIKDESGNDVIITPTTPKLEDITYEFGLVLGNVTLPTDWKWKDSNIELSAGTKEYDAIYVPNQDNVKIEVTVLKNSKPNYAVVQNLKGVEGDKLSTITLPAEWKWKNPDEELSLKESKYTAVFTHSSGNYEDIEVLVDVAVTAKKVDNTGGTNTDKDKDKDKNPNNPGTVSKPGTTNKPSTAKPQKGKVYTVGGIQYKVTNTTSKTASIVGLSKSAKKKKTITIKKTVKILKVSFKITEIGSSAFTSCKKLQKVTIGENVTKIGKKAFYKCSKLKTITIKSKKLKSAGKNAFKGIYKKAVIKVPKSKLKNYKKLLKKKGQSSKVKIKK